MELILWRHCDAESGVPDELRPLTPRGRKDAERMARWLVSRLPVDCRILVSPAVRAQQTAQALDRPFETVRDLAASASVTDVLRVADWPNARAALVVGHEPTLGRVAAYLLSGEATDHPLGKGAVVWLSNQADEGGATAVIEFAIEPDRVDF